MHNQKKEKNTIRNAVSNIGNEYWKDEVYNKNDNYDHGNNDTAINTINKVTQRKTKFAKRKKNRQSIVYKKWH